MTRQQDDPVFLRIESQRRPNESDADFARRMGQTPGTFSEWKRGVSKPSKRETLVEVANGLGVSLDWLLGRENSDDTRPPRPAIVHQLNKLIEWIQGEAVEWEPDTVKGGAGGEPAGNGKPTKEKDGGGGQ